LYSSLALALDSLGNPHISYYDATNGDLKYAFRDSGGAWNVQKVDYGSANDVGKYSSLALDSLGNPHISYYDDTSEDQKDLKYAFRDSSGSWTVQMLDGGDLNDVGRYSSIAIDKADHPHISYYDNTTSKNDLKYIFWEDNFGWTLKIGETQGDVGQYTSIALDDNDRPHFSYYDAENGDLMYADLDSFCGNGESKITRFGLRMCEAGQGMWDLDHDWEIYTKKWPAVKAALVEADKAPRDMFYSNGLNASGAVYPWFVASGHSSPGTGDPRLWTGLLWDNVTGSTCGSVDCYPDFPRLNCAGDPDILQTCSVFYEGTNELTLTYLTDPEHQPLLRPRRWGIIWIDFPGPSLIDAIIKSNFPTLKAIYIPAILK
jgi:hypothetical protein